MNATLLAKTAYGHASAPVRSAADTEYDAFARITSRLNAAAPGPETVSALHENRRLWTLLGSLVAEPENALPPETRARILYLAEFTFTHTSKILAGKADRAILIEINGAIMRGLRDRVGAA
ncbi:flagellar biosynthesis regulatory protein FlaF [Palleronia sediminis]|uniref:Flagellar biosynthesis regulatory protein FlaF n=1 Tax=Palleronia sediminis TaxID=2547833 RepID=A0A4R6AEY3_9RHOB|nr:flagellar biosynthesis regulator FlaF [Palleronia sediminis]TDL81524.1 flagellar biosynthesis regulatory protein FlaF [Palleronia sediminis]